MLKYESKHFLRIFLYLTIVIVLTITTLSSILYFNFEHILSDTIYNSTCSKLYQSSFSIYFLGKTVENVARQISSDYIIKQLMTSDLDNPIELYSSLNKLHSYRLSYPMIHSIYIYNRRKSNIFASTSNGPPSLSTSDEFFDQEILEYLYTINTYRRFSPIPRTITLAIPPSYSETRFVYTYIFGDQYLATNSMDNVFVLNISADWLMDTLQAMNEQEITDQSTFIINKDGLVVFSDESKDINIDLSDTSYIQKILNSKDDSGYFIDEVDGIKQLVIYVGSKYYDWHFVSTIPYNSIVEKINSQRNITLIISLAILIFGVLISLIVSRVLNSPIKDVYKKLLKLENEKRSNMVEIKNKLLTALLTGKLHENNYTFIDELMSSGTLRANMFSPMIIILLRVDNYSSYCNNYDITARKEINTKVLQVASQVLTPCSNIECIELNDDKLALIANVDSENHEIENLRDWLFRYIKSFQNTTNGLTGISFSIAVSRIAHNYRDLPLHYGEVSNLLMYRFSMGHKCILFPSDIENPNSQLPEYSLKNEQALTEAIMMEKKEDAIKIFRQIIDQVGIAPIQVYHHILNQVFFIVRSAFQAKINDVDAFSSELNDFFETLQTLETVQQADTAFLKLFNSLFAYIHDIKKTRYDDLVVCIYDYVYNNYQNNTLSVSDIADEVNMSAAYIGKLFKQLTSKSIPKFILEVRLSKAEELLTTTEMSVNDIARLTGFTNSSYFYNLFKKKHGITPNQFRQKSTNLGT